MRRTGVESTTNLPWMSIYRGFHPIPVIFYPDLTDPKIGTATAAGEIRFFLASGSADG